MVMIQQTKYIFYDIIRISPPTWPWQGDTLGTLVAEASFLCWGHRVVNKDESEEGFKDHGRMLDCGNISSISNNMQMLKRRSLDFALH